MSARPHLRGLRELARGTRDHADRRRQPELAAFGLAAGSDLLNAGAVTAGALPFDPADYYSGLPDLGAGEKR